MKRLYYTLLAVAILSSCNKPAELQTGVDFASERIAPLMFRFTNLSTGYAEYRWDFGDGTFSLGVDALHTYETTGTYTVSLMATTETGARAIHQQTIDITTPAVYFAGVTYYRIPYDNRYYKVVFKDDALLPSSWDFQTQYTPMLSADYLPYHYQFTTPRILQSPSTHTYYSIQVFRTENAANSNGDVSCMKQQLKVSDLLRYLPEYVLQTESGATAIGIKMQYSY